MSSRLEQLQKQKQELEAKIKATQEKETARQRKLDDRRKFIVGEVVLRLVERGLLSQEWLNKALDQELLRKSDRLLFDLPIRDADQENDFVSSPQTVQSVINGLDV